MKLIHGKLARSIWLFDIQDMNPRGKDILSDLVTWIKDAYSFAESPDPNNPIPNGVPSAISSAPQRPLETPPSGLMFRKGSFQSEEEIFVTINSLTIYDDGIVTEVASSTEDGDRFADDLLRSASTEFKLAYDSDTVRRRLYISELIVRSELNLNSLNPMLSQFAAGLSASTGKGAPVTFAVGGISFWSDIDDAGKQRVVRLERQAGKAFSENRYFSDAPMPTQKHLSVLEEFERSVMRTVS